MTEKPFEVVDTLGDDEPVGCWTEAGAYALARLLSPAAWPGRYKAQPRAARADRSIDA